MKNMFLRKCWIQWFSVFVIANIIIVATCQAEVKKLSNGLRLSTDISKDGQTKKSNDGTYRRPVLFSGAVEALDSTPILVPSSTNSNVVNVRFFVPEGTSVKAGDVVLRIDSEASTEIEQNELQLVQIRERGLREAADFEAQSIDAERNLATVQAALAKAKIDANLPKEVIPSISFDRYHDELERAKRDLVVKQKALENAKDAVKRKLEDSALEAKKLQIQIAFAKAQQAQAEVLAERDGIVLHGYNALSGKRLDEGARSLTGSTAGQILGDGHLDVIAWVLEADRPYLKEQQTLNVRFDAIPNSRTTGTIKRIGNAPEARAIWGNGRYFRVQISLPDDLKLAVQQGMSAQLELIENSKTLQNVDATKKPRPVEKLATSITVEGEVLSRVSIMISPPNIRHVWQYGLVMLAPDGSQVEQGKPVAIFEAKDVLTRLESFRSGLNEKQRLMEKLVLDHAEAAKAADLAVAEAKSNSEKAERKASLPRELVKRNDYDKQVIERDLFARLAQFAIRQRDAKKLAREAEYRGLQSEMATMKSNIDVLEKGKKGLTVLAPRTGTVVHLTNYDGEKIAVGTKVFMGSPAATLADPQKLFVLAKVPEAQISLVRLGQQVKVSVPGSSDKLMAKVVAMGAIFHGKSTSQPITVRDIELEFINLPKNLKPGTAVQVYLNDANEKSQPTSSAKNGGAK